MPALSTILIGAGATVVMGASLPMLFGFRGVGIAARSIASLFQKVIGNVVKGSWFALLTSLGMRGVFPQIVTVGGIIVGIGMGLLFL